VSGWCVFLNPYCDLDFACLRLGEVAFVACWVELVSELRETERRVMRKWVRVEEYNKRWRDVLLVPKFLGRDCEHLGISILPI